VAADSALHAGWTTANELRLVLLYCDDFYWPEHATVLETDGLLKYDGRDRRALVHEKLRQERLEELGLQVVRATWRQLLDEPARVADRIRRAFQIAATRPPPTVWMEVDPK